MPSRVLANWSRYLGALALLGVGLDHLEQFSVDSYSVIPTIGTLFALNFASAALLAAGLAAPVQRLPGHAGRLALPLLGLAGIGIAAGSLAGLLLSESTGLFGFMVAVAQRSVRSGRASGSALIARAASPRRPASQVPVVASVCVWSLSRL